MTPDEFEAQVDASYRRWKAWMNSGSLDTFADGIAHAPPPIEAEGLMMTLIEFVMELERDNGKPNPASQWMRAILPLSTWHVEITQLLGLAYAIGWAQAKEHGHAE